MPRYTVKKCPVCGTNTEHKQIGNSKKYECGSPFHWRNAAKGK